ncbi:S9 family peptidase [Aliikangiella sp. G2MR2-5]|uniref:alpha/beta hydrolase family protein n=1 Tax=Aliikangiella sp. G2MR2-5 TaxID=2788943 RepID=UPI001FEDD053|nr:prolyl oligopeptidase family serine peptidase [Aliikangiella sp. G2MR2-5]
MKSIKPYGSWQSKLTSNLLAQKGKRFGQMHLDDGWLYWLESRASEQGRGVIVRSSNKSLCEEVLPDSVSVRTKVHEYGGGDFLVKQGSVYFSNADDNRVYVFENGELTALTPVETNVEDRYADFDLHEASQSLICVRERHQGETVLNQLVRIDLKLKRVEVLHEGFDFYSYPRISPLGHRLCWTCWNQPDMPWDSAELWLADIHDSGQIDAVHKVTGGDNVSVFQPEWSHGGVLHYISDASGWSNIYSHQGGMLNALAPTNNDFGVPQWVFGQGTYTITHDDKIYALYFVEGQQQLCLIEEDSGHVEPVALPFKHFEGRLLSDEDNLYFCASGPAIELAMYRLDLASGRYHALSEISPFVLPAGDVSIAQPISFPSANERTAYAFYYPPKSSEFEASENDLPPLIVMSHGGPTAATNCALDPGIQFWTNRGFAVVDVNYGGSTGFGKAYRDQLNGQWGVIDVEDCIAAANFLVAEKRANPDGLFIRGGSAGGYTTLCALTFFDVFTAGMSRYGVSDLEALANECHKFEGSYSDKLVGPLPDAIDIYKARSPIYHTEQLACPILILQGADDKVVPPNQAEKMVCALEEKKIPYAYLLFEGEGHGFRNAETVVKALNAELYFYRKILGVESDENIDAIEIKHLN